MPNSSPTIVRGIITSITDFENYDEIVNIFTNRGNISFLARGTRKPQSKNKTALQLGNLVECELFLARLKGKMSKLKKSHIIYQVNITNFKERNFFLKLINYLSRVDNGYYFHYLEDLPNQIKPKKWLPLLTWHLNKMISTIGHSQNSTNCVRCKSKIKIAGFSYLEGGLMCIDHITMNKYRYPQVIVEEFIIINKMSAIDYLNSYSYMAQSFLLQELQKFWRTI